MIINVITGNKNIGKTRTCIEFLNGKTFKHVVYNSYDLEMQKLLEKFNTFHKDSRIKQLSLNCLSDSDDPLESVKDDTEVLIVERFKTSKMLQEMVDSNHENPAKHMLHNLIDMTKKTNVEYLIVTEFSKTQLIQKSLVV